MKTAGLQPAAAPTLPAGADAPDDEQKANERLRRLRCESGLSRAAIAAHAGISVGRYNGIENGCQRAPSLDTAAAIAAVLGVTIDAAFAVHACACGCGERTIGRFRSGHNARTAEHARRLVELRRPRAEARMRANGLLAEKVCERCGHSYSRWDGRHRQRLAHWRERRYCTHAHACPPPAPLGCARPACEHEFRPKHSAQIYCSLRCATKHRYELGKVPMAFLTAMLWVRCQRNQALQPGLPDDTLARLPGQVRRRFKLQSTKSPGRPPKWPQELREQARELHAAGNSYGRISVVTGIPKDTVREIVGARERAA